jgi:hypothetical protein
MSYAKRERKNPLFRLFSDAMSFAMRQSKSAPALLKHAPSEVPEGPVSDLETLPNVGPVTRKKLQAMGIHTVADLRAERELCGSTHSFLNKLKGLYRYKKLVGYVEQELL